MRSVLSATITPIILVLVQSAGCAVSQDGQEAPPLELAATVAALIGDHLEGVSDSEFSAAKAAFASREDADEGLGPIFNGLGCGDCHSQGALGGASEALERRFGRVVDGRFDGFDDRGGSLRQLQTLGEWVTGNGGVCSVPLETEPPEATVHDVGRLSTPLFGLGLVDAMPDSFFQDLARSQSRSVRGTARTVSVLLPDPGDPDQRVGSRRVGRFGWKAGVPNLVQFAADAYLNEMGITTQHCFRGQSITAFATEPAPNGVAVPIECEDGLPGVDDAVGPCTDGLTEIQEDIELFAKFMTFLAPPERLLSERELQATTSETQTASTQTASASTQGARGDRNNTQNSGARLFDDVGCGECHTRRAFRTPATPHNGVPGNFTFFPFSDFLLHDMGALGDQIGNAGDSEANTRRMRTAPLWGIRFRTLLLHDGRARTIEQAVQAHSGQAADSARQFARLNGQDRQRLVQFISRM